MTPGARRGAADRGSGSVLVIALVAVSVVLAGVVGLMAGVQTARARAQAAADLGALAGAHRLLVGAGDACARAREVVERNGATLVRCEEVGAGAVAVRTVVPSPVGGAAAAARAGPREHRTG